MTLRAMCAAPGPEASLNLHGIPPGMILAEDGARSSVLSGSLRSLDVSGGAGGAAFNSNTISDFSGPCNAAGSSELPGAQGVLSACGTETYAQVRKQCLQIPFAAVFHKGFLSACGDFLLHC
jgi:hypothetical protein